MCTGNRPAGGTAVGASSHPVRQRRPSWSAVPSESEAGALCPDGGVGTVTGVYDGLLRQHQQPRADRVLDQVGVAEGSAGGSRPPGEQRVAGEHTAEVAKVEADRAGGMSGRNRIGAPVAARNAGATRTWSSWAWVQMIAWTLRPATTAKMASTSCGASMTTHCWSSPMTQMLLSTSKVSPSNENVPATTA